MDPQWEVAACTVYFSEGIAPSTDTDVAANSLIRAKRTRGKWSAKMPTTTKSFHIGFNVYSPLNPFSKIADM